MDLNQKSKLIYFCTGSEQNKGCSGVLIDQNFILTGNVQCALCIKSTVKTGNAAFHMKRIFLISAAHWVTKNYTLSSNRLSEHNLASKIDCECETQECADPIIEMPIDETTVHENYDPESFSQHNCIALIRLVKPITYSDFVLPICMPVDEYFRTKTSSICQCYC